MAIIYICNFKWEDKYRSETGREALSGHVTCGFLQVNRILIERWILDHGNVGSNVPISNTKWKVHNIRKSNAGLERRHFLKREIYFCPSANKDNPWPIHVCILASGARFKELSIRTQSNRSFLTSGRCGLPQWLRWWRTCWPGEETWVWSLGWDDPLEKEMATRSSILVWEMSRTEKPGVRLSMGSQRVGLVWTTSWKV